MVYVVTHLLVIILTDSIEVVQQKLFNHFTTARVVVQIFIKPNENLAETKNKQLKDSKKE